MPPAAQLTSMHTCPMVTGIVPHVGMPVSLCSSVTVLISGLPAATQGDIALCAGPPDTILKGSSTVFICGKPAARMGDTTAHGGIICMGAFTVMIGG